MPMTMWDLVHRLFDTNADIQISLFFVCLFPFLISQFRAVEISV